MSDTPNIPDDDLDDFLDVSAPLDPRLAAFAAAGRARIERIKALLSQWSGYLPHLNCGKNIRNFFGQKRQWTPEQVGRLNLPMIEEYLESWLQEERANRTPDDPAAGLNAKPNPTDDETGKWSDPKSPSEWERIFKMSWKTIKRRDATGEIRLQKITTKSYRVAVACLPQADQSKQKPPAK